MDFAAVADAIAEYYTPPTNGRPSVIANTSVIAIFLSEVYSGVHMEPAAELAGLASNTVRNWLKRGESGEEPYHTFLRAFKRARSEAESKVTKNILKASEDPRFWAAGATYLERTYPDRWARRNEDNNAPRIVVQIGARDSDVRVEVQAAPQLESGHHNADYQTQRLGESEE